ncbi:MAG: response regulator [Planctomycetaceae bacterium]
MMHAQSVLLVDSDRNLATCLRSVFSELHFRVQIATTRREAVRLALQQSFALCLVSHGLSDGNGLALLRESLCHRSKTTGILLSRYVDLKTVQQALEYGYAHVLEQPVQISELRKLLQRIPGMRCRGAEADTELPLPDASTQAFNWDLSRIARLSDDQIRNQLPVEELIMIIRRVDYPYTGKERLEFFDRDTLERVVLLVRRWSRIRLIRLNRSQTSPNLPALPESVSSPSSTGRGPAVSG